MILPAIRSEWGEGVFETSRNGSFQPECGNFKRERHKNAACVTGGVL